VLYYELQYFNEFASLYYQRISKSLLSTKAQVSVIMSQSSGATATGFHRVISESDSVDCLGKQPPKSPPRVVYLNNPDSAVVDDDEVMEDADDEAMDYEEDNVPRRLAESSKQSVSSGWSLSDGSTGLFPDSAFMQQQPAAAEPVIQQHEKPPPPQQQQEITSKEGSPAGPQQGPEGYGRGIIMVRSSPILTPTGGSRGLQRMDSGSSGSLRAKSENSSNDWGYGWYEDVHASENLTGSNNRPSDRKSSRKHGLVPHMVPKDDSQGRSVEGSCLCVRV
jgi:hypothetical protein